MLQRAWLTFLETNLENPVHLLFELDFIELIRILSRIRVGFLICVNKVTIGKEEKNSHKRNNKTKS